MKGSDRVDARKRWHMGGHQLKKVGVRLGGAYGPVQLLCLVFLANLIPKVCRRQLAAVCLQLWVLHVVRAWLLLRDAGRSPCPVGMLLLLPPLLLPPLLRMCWLRCVCGSTRVLRLCCSLCSGSMEPRALTWRPAWPVGEPSWRGCWP